MSHTITWHGHSAFQITTPSASVLIDPFLEGNPTANVSAAEVETPSVILVTHDHADHTGQVVQVAQASGAMVGCVVETAARLLQAGIPQEQFLNGIGFNIGGTLILPGLAVTMTHAYHSSETGVPVGYILTLDNGYTIYHAGDTAIFSEMALWGKLYQIDLALLPIGGVFTMDPRQAALACELLGAEAVTPMHWGTFPALEKSTESFRSHLAQAAPDCELREMAPGQTLPLTKRADTCGCDT